MAKSAETSESEAQDEPASERRKLSARSNARVAAVQALYQMDMAQTDLSEVIAEFEQHRFGKAEEGGTPGGADSQFFADLLRGVVRLQREIDPIVDARLAEGWRLSRLDSILRAILRAGVFELIERREIPAKVVISEYLGVAGAFLAKDDIKVVNAVLDRIAHQQRPNELDRV
jgi:transcription antitermination protein NusB